MPNRHSFRFQFFLFLLIWGLALVGCSNDDESNQDATGPGITGGSGDVFVVTSPLKLDVSWILTLPGGETIHGMNGFELRNQPPGDYTISWSSAPGWNKPRYENVTRTLESGSDLTFSAVYLSKPGTIQINIEPSGLDAPWTLVFPGETDSLVSSGDTTLVSMLPGVYDMKWGVVAEFDTLDSDSGSLGTRNPLYITGSYGVKANNIFVNPIPVEANAPWSIAGPEGFTASGQGPNSVPFAASGDYIITWNNVDGMIAPEPYTVSVDFEVSPADPADEDAVFSFAVTGEYLFITGEINVNGTVGDSDLPWTLTSPSNAVQLGVGNVQLTGMHPGSYTVAWLPGDGWVVPAGETLELTPGGNTSFALSAEAAVTVRPLPADLAASWQLTGPGGYSLDGSGEALVDGLAPGSYTINWNAVSGWTPPAASSQTLAADHGLVFEEHFVQGDHTLFVNTAPLSLAIPWVVTGPDGFDQSGTGNATMALVGNGDYTVTWGQVDGYVTPISETVHFSGGNNLEAKATYQPSLDMVRVADGSFVMGSSSTEDCRSGFENRHLVTLDKSFFIKTTEVTNGEFISMAQWAYDHGYVVVDDTAVFDNLDGSTVELLDLDDGDVEIIFENGQFRCREASLLHHPVKEVSWYGAVAYCDWLSLYRGLERAYDHETWICGYTHPSNAAGFRLPTEAEWERACRAGNSTAYARGVDIESMDDICFVVCNADTCLEDLAWFDEDARGWSHEVAQLLPNELGLYDMQGNVEEWCNDWSMDTYYVDQSPPHSPPGPLFGENRIIRGGYFFSPLEDVRSASRSSADPSNAANNIGFRVVLTEGQ